MRNVTDLKAVNVSQPNDKEVVNQFTGELAPNDSAQLEKRVIVVTSRDYDSTESLTAAMTQLSDQVASQSYDELFAAHTKIWADRWNKSDIVIDGDTEAQQGIRFNLFELFSTYYGEDSRLNIGPKGFTGEKYGGATYWDTEAFAVPVYLGITDPKVTRNLLMYRYKQLDGAYHNAKQQGLKGALFPMVTFDGIECHNEWEITFEEIHRNGDIAFAIYNYTRYTGDTSYVLNEGSKVLTEISRFWADRVHYSQRNKNYMIHGVTGPDEYENNVDNNWYTNILAQWTLKYTLEILKEVSPEQAQKLNVSDDEKKHWQDIVDHMYLPYDKDLISLFNMTASWTKTSSRSQKFLPTNCHLTRIGHGIKSCVRHTSSREMFFKEFGTSSMISRRKRRNQTLTSTSNTPFTNQACHRLFTQSWQLIFTMKKRPLNCMSGLLDLTWTTTITTPSTACILQR